jgi:hypothetical protein
MRAHHAGEGFERLGRRPPQAAQSPVVCKHGQLLAADQSLHEMSGGSGARFLKNVLPRGDDRL